MLITQTGNKGHSCMRQSSLARVETAAAWLTKQYSLPLSILWVGASKNLQLESKICQNYGPDTQASTEPREINSNRVNTVNVTKHLQWHRHRSAKLIWETNLDHQMGNLMQLLCRIHPTDHVCALCNLPVWTGAKIKFLIGELKIDAHNELSKLFRWRKLTTNSAQIWNKWSNPISFHFHKFLLPSNLFP